LHISRRGSRRCINPSLRLDAQGVADEETILIVPLATNGDEALSKGYFGIILALDGLTAIITI
jgi:hypothetical protein